MNTTHFRTKQEGYGRQGLYFVFDGNSYYIKSVFPNVKEYYNIDNSDDCFYDEETKEYYDGGGNPINPVDDFDVFLFEKNKEEIGQKLFENLEHEDFEFDFDNATYEQIAEWAFNH